MATPIEAIRERVRTIDLVERETGRTARGPDAGGYWTALCPFHDDHHPSLRVSLDGGYICFSCGAKGGDVLDYWQARQGCDLKAAIRELSDETAVPRGRADGAPIARSRAAAPAAVACAEDDLPAVGEPVSLRRPEKDDLVIAPNVVHVYRSESGDPLGVVLRTEPRGRARKQFVPCRWDGARWWASALDAPRPLYGLERLGAGRQVLVVEGEKAADAAARMAPPGLAVVSWMGGSSAVDRTDWGPLAGKDVILWPDADDAGREAMNKIAGLLAGKASRVRLVEPEGLPPKGDAADLEASGCEDLGAWLRARVREIEARPDSEEPEVLSPPVFADPAEIRADRRDRLPFRILGQRDRQLWVLKDADSRIVGQPLTSLHRREILTTIAPRAVWDDEFGGPGPGGKPLRWTEIGAAVQDYLVREVEGMPEYDPEQIRGRGAWRHPGAGRRLVWNRGDAVYLDGDEQEGHYLDGIVYERGRRLPVPSRIEAVSDDEGARLLEILAAPPWSRPYDDALMGGWIALAPVCGALAWRPHVWLTGPSGSGKSTVLHEIVYAALGRGLCLRVGGRTTEAGIRQSLGQDAIPVLVDEAEPRTSAGVSNILDLARSASTGDTIIMGSAGQSGAVRYHVRSMFCFASVNPSIRRAEDESRITLLQLRKRSGPDSDAQYKRMLDAIDKLLTDDFGARLMLRMVQQLPTVLDSIGVIEDAITARYDSRRLAQQYGALYAGHWCLSHSHVIPASEAAVMAECVPQDSITGQSEETDAHRMVQHFAAYLVEWADGPRERVAIGELIQFAASPVGQHRHAAERVLARWGIRCQGGAVFVAIKYSQLAGHVFRDTAWAQSYPERFLDLDGVERSGQMRFAGGARHYTVSIPIGEFCETDTMDEGAMDDRAEEGI